MSNEEGRQQMKESVVTGLSTAKDTAVAGAGVALENASEMMASVGTATKGGLDFAAEKTK